jgi:hypothetical protein
VLSLHGVVVCWFIQYCPISCSSYSPSLLLHQHVLREFLHMYSMCFRPEMTPEKISSTLSFSNDMYGTVLHDIAPPYLSLRTHNLPVKPLGCSLCWLSHLSLRHWCDDRFQEQGTKSHFRDAVTCPASCPLLPYGFEFLPTRRTIEPRIFFIKIH